MTLRKPKGSKVWVFQCQVDGRQWCRSTKETDLRRARRVAERLATEAALMRERHAGPLTFSSAYVEEVRRIRETTSDSQAERAMYAFEQFLCFLKKDIELFRIDAKLLERFQRHRLRSKRLIRRKVEVPGQAEKQWATVEGSEPIARATVDKEMSFILRLLRRHGQTLERPSCGAGARTEHRAFTPDELKAFFAHCPGRLRLVFALMLATGARPTELVPSKRAAHKVLLKGEVDLKAQVIRLRSGKQRAGRSGAVRVLPIPEELAADLQAQLKSHDSDFVFTSNTNLARDFDQVLAAAGIPKADALGRVLTAHSFRHTYATAVADALGHNPFLVQQALGHAKISTTQQYVHPVLPAVHLDWSGVLAGGRVKRSCKVLEVEADAAS
ncbi:MAG TPA: tyrosine-type recombinase/integrase [Verrucomicrobiota bacterium]|nr:tyrosine-type recombinase/integrase [Verrucomicrobiota bacterium]